MVLVDVLIKVGFAVLTGGLIGLEREYREKAAGFRTMIFICVGSTVFTLLSTQLSKNGGGMGDPGRIAAQIVSGIGFLGAGAIMRSSGRITGLTTAATIWVVAALGMAIGAGYIMAAAAIALAMLLVLLLFPLFERLVHRRNDSRTYSITCPNQPDQVEMLLALFKEHGLRVQTRRLGKTPQDLVCSFTLLGTPQAHENLETQLMEMPEIQAFGS